MDSPQHTPLPARRLKWIVDGLRHRVEKGAEQTLAKLERVKATASAVAEQFQAHERRLADDWQVHLGASTTSWDEAVCSHWDDAEMRAFKAVFETADRESHARRDAKQTIDQATAEAKKRIADVEQRFLRAKDIPLKRLVSTRAKVSEAQEHLRSIEAKVETVLAARSLRIGHDTVTAVPFQPPESAQQALADICAALEQSQLHARRLAEQPLARFFESVWWWATCGLIFVVVAAGLIVSGLAQPLWGVMIGLVATVVVFMLALIGVHPWLKRAMAAEVPMVRGWFRHVQRLIDKALQLAVDENDRELKRLAGKRDQRFEEAKNWRDQQVVEATTKLERLIQELHAQAAEQKRAASVWLSQVLESTNAEFANQLGGEEQSYAREVDKRRNEYQAQQREFEAELQQLSRGGAARVERGKRLALQILERSRRWCGEHFPEWPSLLSAPVQWPELPHEPLLPVGMVSLANNLPAQFIDLRAESDSPTSDAAPLLFAPLRDQYLIITGDPASPRVRDLVRTVLLRALTSLPAGRTQVCVVDPPGLGRDYGWLMHLGDFDPSLVHHRVWTQTAHIAKKLQELALAAEDFIQQSLRNQYQSIVDYNRDAGALAEPYRLLVWSSLPSGLDDQAWKGLQSLLDTGARCGIIPILIIDPAVSWPSPGQLEWIQRRGLNLTLSSDGQAFQASSSEVKSLSVQSIVTADDRVAQELVQEVGRRALRASRVEVPLRCILPASDERWKADSSRSLEIPIGQSGVGRVHSLKLGVGTAQHAIIAGKTGSGKSSLLHALLTSAILKYSPEDLRLVLLDFKKGVEFQVYAEAVVAHADIIGIESQREFGLSALEYIDGCLQRRGEMFRSAGVQDIANWNLLYPEQKMPRMLIVIDEFQELFVEDDKLTSQASLLLDRIVRQGRSFGVHAVLSSQTLAGSYSLPRTTLGQMAVRIALQCDPSDAQIIFADDNPAAARLKHPGQAVYNDAGGRIEGNQPLQIGWLSKADQQAMFAELPSGYINHDRSSNLLGRTIVFDGNRPAQWNCGQAEQAIAVARRDVNPEANWALLGESVAMNPAVVAPLTPQSGRNILLVGSDDAPAASVLNSVVASFVKQSGQGQTLVCIQGARPTDVCGLVLPSLWQKLPIGFEAFDCRHAAAAVGKVHALLQKRMKQDEVEFEGADQLPVLLVLLQLGRMRDLRREDDFASFGSSELTADKQLEEILRDGPVHRLHTLIWAENYSTVNRWLSRAAMREMEIRIAMQMSVNDSTNFLDSAAASRLGDHVLLVVDEATGQEQKFRPFAADSLAEVASWAAGLDEN